MISGRSGSNDLAVFPPGKMCCNTILYKSLVVFLI